AEPVWRVVRLILVPPEALHFGFLSSVDPLDLSAYTILWVAEPFVEAPDSCFADYPDCHRGNDKANPSVKNSLKEYFRGFWSLVTGMRITLQQFFKPIVT